MLWFLLGDLWNLESSGNGLVHAKFMIVPTVVGVMRVATRSLILRYDLHNSPSFDERLAKAVEQKTKEGQGSERASCSFEAAPAPDLPGTQRLGKGAERPNQVDDVDAVKRRPISPRSGSRA